MNPFFKKYNKIILQKNYAKIISKKYDYLSYCKPVIDRCINCGNHEQVHTQITMEFGESNYNSGLICRKCY